MTEIKTNDSLLAALRNAATKNLSAQELHRQRVSFVMGTLKDGSSVTRSFVDSEISKRDGRSHN